MYPDSGLRDRIGKDLESGRDPRQIVDTNPVSMGISEIGVIRLNEGHRIESRFPRIFTRLLRSSEQSLEIMDPRDFRVPACDHALEHILSGLMEMICGDTGRSCLPDENPRARLILPCEFEPVLRMRVAMPHRESFRAHGRRE